VITRLVSLIDDALRYDARGGIPVESFQHAELYTASVDRYSSEDLISGRHGKTTLSLAEVHAEDRRTSRDSKGLTRTRYVNIFRGLLLIADFHKHFRGRTFVFPDTAEKLFGAFGRSLQKLGGRSETRLVELEDPEFESAFVVHGTNQVEARYILSTAMMRRILSMRERFGKDIRIAFKDSCLWLAVPHGKSYLEPDTSIPATDKKQIRSLWEEIRLFLDTIEELDLNTRIWTKE